MDNEMNAIAYCRKSIKGKGKSEVGVEYQRDAINNFCM